MKCCEYKEEFLQEKVKIVMFKKCKQLLLKWKHY